MAPKDAEEKASTTLRSTLEEVTQNSSEVSAAGKTLHLTLRWRMLLMLRILGETSSICHVMEHAPYLVVVDLYVPGTQRSSDPYAYVASGNESNAVL